MKKHFFAAAVLAVCSTLAQADVGVAAVIGTTGYGAQFVVPVKQQFNARLGINAFNYSYADSTEDVNYSFKLKLQTVDLLADYHVFNGAFRITGGAVYNGNKISAEAKPEEATYTINDRTYSSTEVGSLNGRIEFQKAAPYLGIGWGNVVAKDKSGFGFTSDFGVLFQGSPRASLTNTGCTVDTERCAELAKDVAEEEKNFRNDTKSFKAYPVIRVGISYKF